MFDGKVVLITGGTGSFGKKCTEMLLERYNPKKVIIFSRDEFKQYQMAQRFPDTTYPAMRYFIGDVRDKERLYRGFAGVDYVIHAAALKHVPAAEYNPTECVKTNIYGSQNVINVAADRGVEKVVALSTDKAASPVNLYGATKLCSDKLFTAANALMGADQTKYAVVRYGNVIGSRGSVVPLFMKQREQGKLTLTDPRMTRFWITLEQGVDFVLKSFERMKGGETFVPKLPSTNMMDLAKAMAPEAEIDVIGIRPGEKIHEMMITSDDARNTLEYDDYYEILPDNTFLAGRYADNTGKTVAEDFAYDSGTNDWVMGVDEIRELIESLEIEF